MCKRIASTAGFTGLLAALLLTLLQSLWVVPLIQQAETYENAPAEHVHEQAGGVAAEHSHEHDEAAWEPENGWQRVLSTTGGNLVVAVGFALMLAGLYTLRAPGSPLQGAGWGLAGFAVFVLLRPWACHRNCRAPQRPNSVSVSSGGLAPQPLPLPASRC